MRLHREVVTLALLVSIGSFGQDTDRAKSDRERSVALAQRAALAAVNFRQGDAAGFARARAEFTPDGWKDFVKHMEGFLDEKQAPTFTSSFIAARDARVLDENNGVLHLKVPGKLTQSNQLGKTTYDRAAIEAYVLRDQTAGGTSVKIQRLEQITCAKASMACD